MLWAVHLSDGFFQDTPGHLWVLGLGFLVAGLLVGIGLYRIKDEEIPRIAILTAAFFIATTIHIRIPPTSVHLLLNGLIGVILGWRAPVAIFVGLILQFVFVQHGGLTTLGLNTCVLSIPALVFGLLFRQALGIAWLKHPLARFGLVLASGLLGLFSFVFSVNLLLVHPLKNISYAEVQLALANTFHPVSITIVTILALSFAWWERQRGNAPEFPLGLLLGEATVLGTIGIHSLLLLSLGEMFNTPILVWLLIHLPLAFLEGALVGVTVGFLARVKPELLKGYPSAA